MANQVTYGKNNVYMLIFCVLCRSFIFSVLDLNEHIARLTLFNSLNYICYNLLKLNFILCNLLIK